MTLAYKGFQYINGLCIISYINSIRNIDMRTHLLCYIVQGLLSCLSAVRCVRIQYSEPLFSVG